VWVIIVLPAATPVTVTVCGVLHSVSVVAGVKVNSAGSTVAVLSAALATAMVTSPVGSVAKRTV